MASILNVGPRLESIVDLCDKVKVSADIGCDHGYVTSELILQYKSQRVVASDISQSSLNKAIRFCNSINISAYVSFRVGDGFDKITKYDKVKQAVIAGMGGQEIVKILQNCKLNIKTLVLQPMRDVLAVRQFLLQNGYKIVYDFMVYDTDRYYNIIKARKGRAKKMNDLELYFGKDNFDLKNTGFLDYLTVERNKLIKIQKDIGELNEQYSQRLVYLNSALEVFDIKKTLYLKMKKSKQQSPGATKIFKRNGRI